MTTAINTPIISGIKLPSPPTVILTEIGNPLTLEIMGSYFKEMVRLTIDGKTVTVDARTLAHAILTCHPGCQDIKKRK